MTNSMDGGRPAVETAFRTIAQAVDEIGVEKAPLFLAKLALILSNELGDSERLVRCVDRARAGLD